MTNGEKLQKIFPNLEYTILSHTVILDNGALFSLEWWNAEYKKPTTKNDSGVDAVSRAEVKKIAKEMYLEVANMKLDVKTISDCISYTSSKCREVLERKLQALPSVTPQELKTGHWIDTNDDGFIFHRIYKCSHCGNTVCEYPEYIQKCKWCFNCGAKMVEPQESEGKE